MLGAIIGDTVGSVYEFYNTKDYNFRLFSSDSGYTDDTVMTMAVARWLLDAPGHSYEKLEEIMVEFASHCPCPNGGYGTMFYRWLFFPQGLPASPEGAEDICGDYTQPPRRHQGGAGNCRCHLDGKEWPFENRDQGVH